MDKVKRTYPFLLSLDYVCSFILLVLGIMNYHENKPLSIFIIIITILLIFCIYIKHKHTKKHLQYLIQCSEEIIENKKRKINIIDGEGEISLLSHKLYILNQRYEQMTNIIIEDKKNLQTYMENIAHQLKIPITAMKINEEMLMQNTDNHLLTVIYNQTNKLNMLVDELLKLATLESNTMTFQIQSNDIEDIFNDIEDNLLELCLQKNMKLKLSKNIDVINCDRKWMIEALENIIKNCIEKNNDSTIEINIEKNLNTLKIIIKDYGKGFDQIENLFDRFHKSKESQGYGLGLAISKEVIERHHGVIHAKNDNGAVFEIILPIILSKKKI